MSTPKPAQAREPSCIHSGWSAGRREQRFMQPASACRICKDGPELAGRRADWAAWLAENPDSYEAQRVREADAAEQIQPHVH